MSKIRLDDPELQGEYRHLFNTCRIRPDRLSQVDSISSRIRDNEAEYREVADSSGIPWYFIGLIHQMESGGNFHTHLHNGDPLDKRTVGVPAGRPVAGQPPFTWKESAIDAIQYRKWGQWEDWSLPGMLYLLEKYNGMGYREKYHTKTPYLWSFCQHYIKGKYVSDGNYDPNAVSRQAGAAVLLHRMIERGLVILAGPASSPEPSPQPPQALPPETSQPMTYTVKRGDSMWAIAQKFRVSLKELVNANTRIKNPNLIFPGQVINLPSEAHLPHETQPQPPEAAMAKYEALPGDTLEGIARRYGISLGELVRLNDQLLQPGDILTVPQIAAPPGPVAPPVSAGEDPPWLQLAILEKDFYQVAEIPGPEKNQRILMYHASTEGHITIEEGEEGAWCSSFVNWCVTKAGYQGTNSAASVSWRKNGEMLKKPLRGCLVVLWRNDNPQKGHVGFYWGEDPGNPARFLLLGGNQSDRVSIDSKQVAKVRGYRWPLKA